MPRVALNNVILIGMPGSGKSTVGQRLATHFGLQFVDGDALIERAANMPIQRVVDRWGLRRFSDLEASVLCDLSLSNSVISTGGSAVYSEEAMRHLGTLGTRIYLKISRQSLVSRVNNVHSRGLFKFHSHSLLRLYADRENLYPKYADVTFDNNAPFSAVKAHQLCAMLKQAGVVAKPTPQNA